MRMSVIRCLGAALCLSAAMANAQAPVIDAGQPVQSRGKASASSGAAPAAATGDLFMQLQSLQQEVMDLRGLVEEQRHQIETLKQQSLERYSDLDRRLSGQPAAANAGSAPTVADPAAVMPDQNSAAAASAASGVPVQAAPTSSMETAKPEEYEAYQTAYAKLKGQDFPGAIKLFNTFTTNYPRSSLAPNAYYWLGKAYLLAQPQDLNKAQQVFSKVVGDYPQHSKAPDALYELGKVYYLKGDKAKAKTLLQQVIDNYGASGSSAPQLAKQFLDQNLSAAKRG
jgi:tol-pal system protein YbgF